MANMLERRNVVVEAYGDGLLNDEEFVLLYDLNSSRNLNIPYWQYPNFDLDNMQDDECISEFRFLKNDIYGLFDVLGIPEEIICYNGSKLNGVTAFCALLKRFSYPCRYMDMVHRFGIAIPQLSMACNNVMSLIYDRWCHLLQNFQQAWLSRENLTIFCNKIHERGAPLTNCWGFVDGTVRPISRPERNPRVLYNGHKKVHGIKFQSVAAPNGLIANLFGLVEGRRHDSAILAKSGLLQMLECYSVARHGSTLCIYGDPAYPLRPQLQRTFRSAQITNVQNEWNKAMSSVRVSVEWVFGDVINYYQFLDFRKNLKIQLGAVGKMYIVCDSCFYGNSTTLFFDCNPPSIQEYF